MTDVIIVNNNNSMIYDMVDCTTRVMTSSDIFNRINNSYNMCLCVYEASIYASSLHGV